MRRRERCVQAESQSKGILLLGFSQYGVRLCSMKPVYQFGFGLRRAHTPLSETSTSDDDDGDGDGDGDEDNGECSQSFKRQIKGTSCLLKYKHKTPRN